MRPRTRRAIRRGELLVRCRSSEDTVLEVVPSDDYEADQEADALAPWHGAGACIQAKARDAPARSCSRSFHLNLSRPRHEDNAQARDRMASLSRGHTDWRSEVRGSPLLCGWLAWPQARNWRPREAAPTGGDRRVCYFDMPGMEPPTVGPVVAAVTPTNATPATTVTISSRLTRSGLTTGRQRRLLRRRQATR